MDYTINNGTVVDNKGWRVWVRYTKLPTDNDQFGLKTIRMTAPGADISRNIEIFFSRDADNHPGPALNAVRADFANTVPADAPRSPNWFFYWLQAMGNNKFNSVVEDRYGASLITVDGGVPFGVAPAVFRYQDDYSERFARVIIFDPARNVDSDPDNVPGFSGPRQETSGIDTFRDTVIHERYHALNQAVAYTNQAFNLGVSGTSAVTANAWSFNLGVGRLLMTSPGGRVENHGVLDTDQDDVINSADGPGIGIESLAYAAETDVDNTLARSDWGNPGKNHATNDKYDD